MPNGRVIEGSSTTGRAKTKAWRLAVATAEHEHRLAEPLDGPLFLSVRFVMPRPKARRRDVWCTVKPDASKLLRATEDAMTDAGMIHDDARIASLHVVKVYANPADPWTGADITIAQIPADATGLVQLR